jgi:hypothetical protein
VHVGAEFGGEQRGGDGVKSLLVSGRSEVSFGLVRSEGVSGYGRSQDTYGLGPTWHSALSVSPARLSGLLLYLPPQSATPSRACLRGRRRTSSESLLTDDCSVRHSPWFWVAGHSLLGFQQCRLPRAMGWRFPVGKRGARRAGDTDGKLHPADLGVQVLERCPRRTRAYCVNTTAPCN